MNRALYSLLMWLLQPALRWKLRRRAKAEPKYGQAVRERFGYYDDEPGDGGPDQQANRMVVWVHAVSLGETRAASVLVTELRLALPGMRLLLTHGTATGREQGASLLQSGDLQVWQPWDTPAAVGRFLAHFKPHVGLLMETEVWPNLVAQCARVRVPLCLVNARMSEKSLRKAQRLAWLARPAYRGLRAVWAQAPQDAARLASLGAPVKGVFGNFKFDATPDAGQIAQGRAWRMALGRPVIVFANSREGEEAIFLRILKQHVLTATVECAQGAINSEASQVQWMLVPRHPQRFDEVANLCRQEGFTVSRRSQWNAVGPGAADVWLGDSMGEMAQYYAMSDVALLGGSFAPLGGHNLIEATACECPIVMGPHTFNFALAAELALAAGAGFAADDLPHAVDKAMKLVCAEKALRHARAAARSFGALHRGAAQRTASAVRAVLLY